MSSRALIEKIEALPPERRAEVESFVDSLKDRVRAAEPSSPSLVETLRRQRERLLSEHGLYDTLPLIREFRETEGR